MLEGGDGASDTPFHEATVPGMEGHAAALLFPETRFSLISDLLS